MPEVARLAYAIGLVGPVDMDDSRSAWIAYAADLVDAYMLDPTTDPEYAAIVAECERDE